MAFEFHLPDIGEGLVEAVIIEWYVAVGEQVGLDEPLVQVETDKAVVDIPSPRAGTVLHHGAAAGEALAVDELLAVVGEPGEEYLPDTPGPEAAAAAPQPAPAAPIVGTLAEARVQALPAVRRLAAELGVDLAIVGGTGPEGRITADDVRAAAGGPVHMQPFSPIRQAIADHLSRSWREIPHVTTFGEADAFRLLAARKALGGLPLEALFVRLVIPLLEIYPAFNAAVSGSGLLLKKHFDIGVAVDAPEGLAVGVVRGADGYDDAPSLGEEIRRLAAAVKDRTATPDELRGQTFTISNIGAVGGGYGTPIVPYGTTAIVSFGRATERPVVRDGALAIGLMLPISLSYDHRAIDGGIGRAFMTDLVEAIETIDSRPES